jgi:hypothetical protein
VLVPEAGRQVGNNASMELKLGERIESETEAVASLGHRSIDEYTSMGIGYHLYFTLT